MTANHFSPQQTDICSDGRRLVHLPNSLYSVSSSKFDPALVCERLRTEDGTSCWESLFVWTQWVLFLSVQSQSEERTLKNRTESDTGWKLFLKWDEFSSNTTHSSSEYPVWQCAWRIWFRNNHLLYCLLLQSRCLTPFRSHVDVLLFISSGVYGGIHFLMWILDGGAFLWAESRWELWPFVHNIRSLFYVLHQALHSSYHHQTTLRWTFHRTPSSPARRRPTLATWPTPGSGKRTTSSSRSKVTVQYISSPLYSYQTDSLFYVSVLFLWFKSKIWGHFIFFIYFFSVSDTS